MEMQVFRKDAVPIVGDVDTVDGALYFVKNSTTGRIEIHIVSEDGTAIHRAITVADVLALLEENSSDTADKLTTARSITATGDADWTVSFDGSADVSATLTFKTTGVTAGTYANLTVDDKGRITAARALAATDIPSLPGSKINSAISVDTSGNAATATVADRIIGANINGVMFTGQNDITINAVDSTARIAQSEKGAANGVAPLDANGFVPVANLPSYVDDVIEVDDFDKLPGRPSDPGTNGPPAKGKIYVVVDTNDDTTIYRWSGTAYIEIPSGLGTADSALKLATARSIAMTGDGTWSVSFDGSQNVTGALTLANTAVTPGTFANVTVDSKGRVTGIRALQMADIPTLDHTKVASAASIYVANPAW